MVEVNCSNCKHELKGTTEYPCFKCAVFDKTNKTNYFEPKEEVKYIQFDTTLGKDKEGSVFFDEPNKEKYCEKCGCLGLQVEKEGKISCPYCDMKDRFIKFKTKDEESLKANQSMENRKKINTLRSDVDEIKQLIKNETPIRIKIKDLECKVKTHTSRLDYHISRGFEPNTKGDKPSLYEQHLEEKKFSKIKRNHRIYNNIYPLAAMSCITMFFIALVTLISLFFRLLAEDYILEIPLFSLIGFIGSLIIIIYGYAWLAIKSDALADTAKEELRQQAKLLTIEYKLTNYYNYYR